MKTYTWILLILLFVISCLLCSYSEPFSDTTPELLEFAKKAKDMKLPENMPEPQQIIGVLKDLLNKYDKPEMWAHARQVHTMNPAELARMNSQ